MTFFKICIVFAVQRLYGRAIHAYTERKYKMKTFEYTVKDSMGLHARPAGMLAKAAKGFESEITITKGDKTVSCTRLMAVMGMGVKCGDTVTFSISGNDEEAAEKAISEFVNSNL